MSFISKNNGATYVKYRIKSYRVNGKLKHERLLIGKITNENIDGLKTFHPNSNYYSFFKLPLPKLSTVKGPRRSSKDIKVAPERR